MLRACFVVLLAVTLDLPGAITVEARDSVTETIEQGQTESARTRRAFLLPRNEAISPLPAFCQRVGGAAPRVPLELETRTRRYRDHRRTPAANPAPPAASPDDH